MKNLIYGTIQELKTLKRSLYRNIYTKLSDATKDNEIVDLFSQLYYDSHIFDKSWGQMKWMGTPILKCPMDLWIYQELLHKLRPDLIIETGTAAGGSAHYFASLLDLLGQGEIITIDIEARSDRPKLPRVTYLTGSSTEDQIFKKVQQRAQNKKCVMVVLDSDHSKSHVLNELERYNPLVTANSYLIVEDTNINGHPVAPHSGPGPYEAVEEFMRDNKNFFIDDLPKKFFLTWNPNGYLKKRVH